MELERVEPKITNDRAKVDRVRELLNTGNDPGEEPKREEATDDAVPEQEQATQEREPEKQSKAPTSEVDDDERDQGPDDDEESGEQDEDLDDDELPFMSFEQLAERAGLTLEQLYQVAVPMGDGEEPISFGKAKDLALKGRRADERHEKLDKRERAMEDKQSEYERGQLRDRDEMAMLLNVVRAENIPPNVIEHIKASHRRDRETKRAQLLEAFPEFEDRSKYLEFSERAGKMLGSSYGFRPAELSRITDPRLFMWARDTMRLKERVEKAEKDLEEARSKLRGRRRRRGGQARARANGATQPNAAASREKEVSSQVNQLVNRGVR